jgi:anaerobic selenocysteine-containing dehydrogenase
MIPLLSDTSRIGLTVVIDRDMTETAAYADYILPDTTYLERWDICESPPVIKNPGIGVRAPVVGGISPGIGDYHPIFPETRIAEDILALIGASLALDGFQPDESGRRKNAYHYFRNSLNILMEALQADGLYESGMPLDYSQIIDRGGMFVKPKPLETKSHVQTVSLSPIKSTQSTTPGEADGDELVLISYSLPFNRTSRSVVNRWLLEVLPVNRLLMNPQDAEQRGIQQGDRIRLQAASSQFTGECRAHVVPGIRPGVVALAGGFGHTQFGASLMVVNNTISRADKTRATGINPHAVSSGPGIARVRISKV